MNNREMEQLKKKSIYSISINDDLKDQVINDYLYELNKIVKKNLKNKKLVVVVMETN